MQFPLTDEIIDQIVFAMEDQRDAFLVDRFTGELVGKEEMPEEEAVEAELAESAALDGVREERYVPIPDWSPADGFQLMERFVLKLRNPIFAEKLREALASGQGVFRKFKDILRQHREIERRWFNFKDREMRRVVEQWYEEERELAGLERRAAGEETPAELVASDFAIQRGEARHLEPAVKLDRKVFAEELPAADYASARQTLPPLLDRRSLFLAAELPQGEFAGFVWAVPEASRPEALRLVQLAVRKHFRGLGLAAQLLRRLIQEARESGCGRIIVPLRGSTLALAPLFEGLGFSPQAVELGFDLAWPE